MASENHPLLTLEAAREVLRPYRVGTTGECYRIHGRPELVAWFLLVAAVGLFAAALWTAFHLDARSVVGPVTECALGAFGLAALGGFWAIRRFTYTQVQFDGPAIQVRTWFARGKRSYLRIRPEKIRKVLVALDTPVTFTGPRWNVTVHHGDVPNAVQLGDAQNLRRDLLLALASRIVQANESVAAEQLRNVEVETMG